MKDWKKFFQTHKTLLEANYPGLTLERFLKEAEEIDGDEDAFLQGVPFAYQLGYATFTDYDFKVTPDVLIPRPETEQLFEIVDSWLKKHSSLKRLVDIGTGSGCLGISLALAQPQLTVLLTDISAAALQVAETNAYYLRATVTLKASDLFTNVTGLYDVIVSNPPYIPMGNAGVHAKTHEYEPHHALYLEAEKYHEFFERFFFQASRHMSADGVLFMEGHEDFMDVLAELAKKAKLTDIQILKDWSARPRFLRAMAPKTPIG